MEVVDNGDRARDLATGERFWDSWDRRMQRSTGWESGDSDPIRFRLPCGLKPVEWLERGSDRCSLVRVPGGAAWYCWGGGAALTASPEMADGSPATGINHSCNGAQPASCKSLRLRLPALPVLTVVAAEAHQGLTGGHGCPPSTLAGAGEFFQLWPHVPSPHLLHSS